MDWIFTLMNNSSTVKETFEAEQTRNSDKWGGWIVIILALVGFGICLHLYSLHIALLKGEIKSALLCGTEGGLDCHSVASSPYSSLLGLPLPSLGAIFYGVLVLLGIGSVIFWKDSGRAFLRWGFYLALLGLIFDFYLAYVMFVIIKATCWLCIAIYGVSIVIVVFLVIRVLREPKPRIPLRTIFPGKGEAQTTDLYFRNVIKGLLLIGILFTSVAGVAGSQFVSNLLTENDRERLVKIKENLLRKKPILTEVKDRPFMGSEDAKITVVEFSDFLCPYCSRAAKYLKVVEASARETTRFVFRHYPLDKSCNPRLRSNVHPGACLLAEGAVCADEQNKFWEFHDLAFETKGGISRSVVKDIATEIRLDLSAFESCMDSGRGLEVVREDIQAAVRVGVRGTPTLFINGRLLGGVPKPWMLSEILQYSEGSLVSSNPSATPRP